MALELRFEMRTSSELAEEIDDWRAQRRPVPSRGEAVRYLVKKGLESEECCKKCNFAAGRDEAGSPIIGGGTEGGAGA